MSRTVIFGNSGSGKSTLAASLARETGLAHLDLDTLAWDGANPTQRRSLLESQGDVGRFLQAHDKWVIEGCYSDLLAMAIARCGKLIFLNPGIETCIRNCRSRPWEPHKYPSMEAQNRNLEMLVNWVREYETRDDEFSLRRHRELFAQFNGEKIEYTANVPAFNNAQRVHYFAYGSNMAVERLRARVPSAQFACTAELVGHTLKFHKPGMSDGSGKCDAVPTGNGNDRVYGAVFSILESEWPLLDRFEGLDCGYDRTAVSVVAEGIGKMEAQTYLATMFDASLRPLDWYKEHVVRGARAIGLPASYIASIAAVPCDIDTDAQRRADELAIYALPALASSRDR